MLCLLGGKMFVKEYKIPEGVEVKVEGNRVKVKGPKGELEREFRFPPGISISVENNKVRVKSEIDKRKYKALTGTIAAHIRNMMIGVTKGFVYKLRIVYSHFPMNVSVEEGKVVIRNFLGERTARVAEIVGKTEVKVEGNDIIVSGIDIEEVGQTASNIEQATRIIGKDRRVFTDGIFIIEKPLRRL